MSVIVNLLAGMLFTEWLPLTWSLVICFIQKKTELMLQFFPLFKLLDNELVHNCALREIKT